MHIREVYFALVAQETVVLTLSRDRTWSGRLDGRQCTVRIVTPEAVDQGFDWVKLSSSLRQFCGEQVH